MPMPADEVTAWVAERLDAERMPGIGSIRTNVLAAD
jgi:hypothetical protein